MGQEDFPKPPEIEAKTEKQADILDLTQQIETVRQEKIEAMRHIARLADETKEAKERLQSLEKEENDLMAAREKRMAEKD